MKPDHETAARPSLTIRVSRDSGRTWGQTFEVHSVGPLPLMADPMRFPPCGCTRCTGASRTAKVTVTQQEAGDRRVR